MTQATLHQQFCVTSPWKAPAIRVLIPAIIWVAQMVKQAQACGCHKAI